MRELSIVSKSERDCVETLETCVTKTTRTLARALCVGRRLQETTHGSWIDVQFLKTANEMVIDCRRTLKSTYVLHNTLSQQPGVCCVCARARALGASLSTREPLERKRKSACPSKEGGDVCPSFRDFLFRTSRAGLRVLPAAGLDQAARVVREPPTTPRAFHRNTLRSATRVPLGDS